MMDINEYARSLYLSKPLRDPVIRKIIEELQLPLQSYGLDAGCGIGLNSLLLAEAVGPTGRIMGLDISREFLEEARFLASKFGLGDRITFQYGDVAALPFEDNSFDWAWSVDLVGYIPVNPVPFLKELGRVVKPGGKICISMWSSQKLLPGYPILEAQLNATSAGIAPFERNMNPERHFMNAPQWFSQAGFQGISARTFVGDVAAPLSPEIRAALLDLFSMRWGSCQPEVPPEIWNEYLRLCSVNSPDLILNLPNYYAFFTYSLFYGQVV